jgi:hypothetical protein
LWPRGAEAIVTGTAMPNRPGEARLVQVFNTVEPWIEARYGIPVIVTDVPHPFTGDLDGAEIRVDHGIGVEEAVFVLVHLFGHTVQWNVDPELRDFGLQTPAHPSEQWIARVASYELDACRYSLQLFNDAGVTDLDPWLADFAACDLAYLEHFYRTGEKLPFRSFWRDGCPLLQPKPIPDFRPTCWRSRWAGTVL